MKIIKPIIKCHHCHKDFATFPCNIKDYKKHFCSQECYFRYKHEPKPLADIFERFWEKVIHMPEGCWDWIGGLDGGGYPCWKPNGKNIRAHVWIYKMILGPIPYGYEVDHLCSNRACVNPSHLEAVPPLINHRRAIMGYKPNWQSKQTHCRKGHPYDEENTRWTEGKNGHSAPTRVCRTCARETMRQIRKERKYLHHATEATNQSERSIASQFSGVIEAHNIGCHKTDMKM